MDVAKKGNCLSRWYIRYLVATELYMVEPWEKVVIHIVFALFFGLFFYFNCSIILNGISMLRGTREYAAL